MNGNPWERLKPPAKPIDIKEEALHKASKKVRQISFRGKIVTARRREKKRIETVYKVIKKHLLRCRKILRTYYDSHEFYKDLISIYYPPDNIKIMIKRIEGSIRTLENLYNYFIRQLKTAKTPEEARKIRKEGLGRLVSIPLRQKKIIRETIEIWRYAHRLPSINFEEPIVVIAGPPNVGKSSLVNKLSTAEVRVASYPFTTKDIHLGHFNYKYYRIQLIDTPGILDKPLEERNEIELKAIYVLKHLPDLIIYMVDPSPSRYYEPDIQLKIYNDIKTLFQDKKILFVINKIDKEEIDFTKYIRDKDYIKISILEEIGVDHLKKKIISGLLKETTL
jgi:nucleolar GTP-binding protein